MKEKKSVLFVCLGNICRSPLAEGILKKKLEDRNISSDFLVDSCGTSNYHIGDSPDPRTQQNALQNGVELVHGARQLNLNDLQSFDDILVMDQSNLSATLGLDKSGNFRNKIHLLRDFDRAEPGADVPDPYYGGPNGFQNVFDIIDRSVEEWLKENNY